MKRLSIIQTADIHGRIRDYAYIAAFVDHLRESGEDVLIVDSGDIFRGHILSENSKGMLTAKIMNTIHYDCMVFGNDEHFSGLEEINEMRSALRFPVLGSLTRTENEDYLFEPYAIIEKGGFRIGIIGLEAVDVMPPGEMFPAGPPPDSMMKGSHPADRTLGPESNNWQHREDMKRSTDRTYQEVSKWVPVLKDKQCDLIIIVSHLGVDDGYRTPTPKLAQEISGIDIIADGHSHHPLPDGITVGNTIVAQPADRMESFVYMTVVEENGVIKTDYQLISLEWCKTHLKPNTVVQAMLDSEWNSIVEKTEIIVEVPFVLDGGRPQIRSEETNLGDLVCDAFLHATDADIAICGGGAIRASIDAGPVTAYDIHSVFANGGELSVYDCPGDWLIGQLEDSISHCPIQYPGFLHVAGIRIVFDINLDPGKRIISAVLDSGEKLETDKRYSVAGSFGPGPLMNAEAYGCIKIERIGSIENVLTDYMRLIDITKYENPAGRIISFSSYQE